MCRTWYRKDNSIKGCHPNEKTCSKDPVPAPPPDPQLVHKIHDSIKAGLTRPSKYIATQTGLSNEGVAKTAYKETGITCADTHPRDTVGSSYLLNSDQRNFWSSRGENHEPGFHAEIDRHRSCHCDVRADGHTQVIGGSNVDLRQLKHLSAIDVI